jgi:hypothetical protein
MGRDVRRTGNSLSSADYDMMINTLGPRRPRPTIAVAMLDACAITSCVVWIQKSVEATPNPSEGG